ncbi:nucleoside triphosphate pyrophosphohydrolase [Lichenifustis flavocetrariae]|uniref:Nucleoside triphosphate pyrophosphohydrolase n=1 Tax=Lichenifustis flavocetrariae TaxID=2949735 RepID=A0AA41YXZ5_9HYPH|nr:nucleoside triphosphate pyrophosphohydrolase [Lichenifustis flavocetrariae]MCW6509326.1 nucleoside triphosphate pyrophosphohydrolase [Lichenifustis flavocetrariae]
MDRSRDISALLAIMVRLRHPSEGCAWDIDQTFESIVPYTLEEAYEVADAIERRDYEDLRDELGDLLLQVVFHARIAEEQGTFDFGDVVDAITAKLIRRHPHVFGTVRNLSPADVKALWGEIKAKEKRERGERRGLGPIGLLDDVSTNHPALTQALKLQDKAASVGFDWNDVGLVIEKIQEELAEVTDALEQRDHSAIEDEIGDLLFSVVNLARHAGVDPESALRSGNRKFRRRFGHVERGLAAQGRRPAEASLDEMESLWRRAKLDEPPRLNDAPGQKPPPSSPEGTGA